MTSRISGVPRVLGQVTTGAAFAVFFGLTGVAVAHAKESPGADACKASTTGCGGGGGGDKGKTGDRVLGLAPSKTQRVPQILKEPEKGDLKKKGEQLKPAEPKKAAPKQRSVQPRDKDDHDEKDHKPKQKERDNDERDHDDDKQDDRKKNHDGDGDDDRKSKKDDRGSGRENRDHDDDRGDRKKNRDDDGDDDDGRKSEEDGRHTKRENREHDDDDRASEKDDQWDEGQDRKAEKRHDDDDRAERRDKKPSKAERRSNVRTRSMPATYVPTTRLASLTRPAGGDGGIPWGDEDNFVRPGCEQDNDGCELVWDYASRITKPIQEAIGRLLKVESTGPDAGFKPEGPNRKGRIFSVEGYAYADQGKWSALDGLIEGEYSIGIDGKLELSITKEGPQIDLEALLGAKVTGPEMEVPLGPLLVKAQPEISAGIGGQYGVGVERGEDGKRRIKAKGGLTGPVGGSTGLETDLNDDYFGQLPDGGY
ncbi:hypothetical protein SD37_40785 [Amycolatopsis orientalis]|uniref:Uncharacterized protein n=1 Tax=Amycolatopsis orientalis TaxID=31958 RepID=A0A193CA14_AMYOR|nr:hypothetical protein [Amycolatopsis orientalis]ANN21289.1 hypothetical protein SD37_40785 [Amycolatopsis orientalis]